MQRPDAREGAVAEMVGVQRLNVGFAPQFSPFHWTDGDPRSGHSFTLVHGALGALYLLDTGLRG